jgi:hypothetical protein
MNLHSTFNQPNLLQITDDFVVGSAETGEIGTAGWNFTNGTVAWINAINNEIGVIRRTTSATANQVASMFLADITNRAVFTYRAFERFEIWLRGVVVSADATYRVGIMNDVAGNPTTSGIYFERLSTDTNWFIVVRNAGVQQRVDTGIAFNITTWLKFIAVRKGNGDVDFFSGNLLLFTITTDNVNLPTIATGLNVGIQVIPTTTTARSLDIDFFNINLLR